MFVKFNTSERLVHLLQRSNINEMYENNLLFSLGVLQKRELFKTQNYLNLKLFKIILQILIYLST